MFSSIVTVQECDATTGAIIDAVGNQIFKIIFVPALIKQQLKLCHSLVRSVLYSTRKPNAKLRQAIKAYSVAKVAVVKMAAIHSEKYFKFLQT